MSPSRPPTDSFDQNPFAAAGLFGTVLCLSLGVMLFGAGPESGLLLSHGKFIYPWEWLTSLFVVPGFFSLLFHAACLWFFAQIVEAKVGWKRFLPLTILPPMLLAGIEQFFTMNAKEMLPTTSNSLLIYHLAGLAFMWVPSLDINPLGEYLTRRNNFTPITIRVWIAVLVFVGVDSFITNLFGSYSGHAGYNVFAILAGMTIAYRMIHSHKVVSNADDLLTNIADAFISRKFRSTQFDAPEVEQLRKKKKKKRPVPKVVEEDDEDEDDEEEEDEKVKPSVRLVRAFDTMVDGGNSQGALNQVELIRQLMPDWQIPGEQLHKLIDQTQQMKLWHLCIPLMEEYVSRFEADADTVRLRLSKILVDDQQRPRHALRVLSQIPPDRLGAEMENTRKKIEEAALVQIEDGVLELESGGWTPNVN